MASDELANWQLKAPHGFVRDGSAYVLLCPPSLADSDKCQRFTAWVMAQAQSGAQNDEPGPKSAPQVR